MTPNEFIAIPISENLSTFIRETSQSRCQLTQRPATGQCAENAHME